MFKFIKKFFERKVYKVGNTRCMKKLLLILPTLLIGVSLSASPSHETLRLFHEVKISAMSLGLLFCDKVDENIDCSFDYGSDKLIIIASLPEDFGLNIGFSDIPIKPRPSDIERCTQVFSQTALKSFYFQWSVDRNVSERFDYNEFTEAFFERGITTNKDGKRINDSLNDWFAKNIRFEAFLGKKDRLDEEKTGLVCSFQLFKDRFVSIRNDNYRGFLKGLD